jgi:hypothetical protein
LGLAGKTGLTVFLILAGAHRNYTVKYTVKIFRCIGTGATAISQKQNDLNKLQRPEGSLIMEFR